MLALKEKKKIWLKLGDADFRTMIIYVKYRSLLSHGISTMTGPKAERSLEPLEWLKSDGC